MANNPPEKASFSAAPLRQAQEIRLSVIIPVYNGEKYIADAIESVLAQTMHEFELVVVDDGSDDGTSEVIASFSDSRIRYMRKQNQRGVSLARNYGASQATGKYLAFLDADDVWMPRKLEEQMSLIASDSNLALVYSPYAITNEILQPITIIRSSERQLNIEGLILTEVNGIGFGSTALVRRDAFDRCGGFAQNLSVGADLYLLAQIAARYQMAGTQKCLVLYRVHEGQMHRDGLALERDGMWILRRHFLEQLGNRALYQRGIANLHTRLFVYRIRSGEFRLALASLLTVVRSRPDRFLRLPVEAMSRRIKRQRQYRSLAAALVEEIKLLCAYLGVSNPD